MHRERESLRETEKPIDRQEDIRKDIWRDRHRLGERVTQKDKEKVCLCAPTDRHGKIDR